MSYFRCGGGNGVTVTVDGVEVEDELKLSSCGTIGVSASVLPYPFRCGTAVVLNGEIHILGGYKDGQDNRNCNHYKLDKNKKQWVNVSTLPYELYNRQAVVFNGEIHVLGFYDGRQSYNEHYKFDGTSWTSVSTLPFGTTRRAVVLNGEIHTLVGTKHYKFDGTSWTEVSTLPFNFRCGSVVVLNGEIHILGGGDGDSIYYSGSNKHYKFDGTSWTSVSTLPFNLSYGNNAVVLNGEIHVLGSYISYYTHYKYDNNGWISVDILPHKVTDSSVVVLNGEIHTLGGNGGDDSDYDMEVRNRHTIIGIKAYKIV